MRVSVWKTCLWANMCIDVHDCVCACVCVRVTLFVFEMQCFFSKHGCNKLVDLGLVFYSCVCVCVCVCVVPFVVELECAFSVHGRHELADHSLGFVSLIKTKHPHMGNQPGYCTDAHTAHLPFNVICDLLLRQTGERERERERERGERERGRAGEERESQRRAEIHRA